MTGDAVSLVHPELSVIIPVLNEAENIGPLLDRLLPILKGCVASYEIVFVDDGSTDATVAAIHRANQSDPWVGCVSFSRNFGKEIAIAAGLDHATGAASVIIDADLQHPPEMIATFVQRWREGYKNVYGQRVDRSDDSRLRRALTQRFYKIFGSVGETRLPEGAGDFRLLDAQAVAALRTLRECARFNKGLYAWIGFKSIGVPFEVESRAFGASKFSYRKLTRFALDGLMSFSTLPLMVWTYVGTVISVIALATAIYFVGETLFYGADVPGFASLIVSVTFLAGVQLLSLGVIGEYIGRIFAEVKRRPLYLVQARIGALPQVDAVADTFARYEPPSDRVGDPRHHDRGQDSRGHV